MTLEELLSNCVRMNELQRTNNRPLIKLYINLRHVQYYKNNLGIPLTFIFHHVLKHNSLDSLGEAERKCPIIIKCADLDSLLELENAGSKLPRIFAVEESQRLRWGKISRAAHGIDLAIPLIFDYRFGGRVEKRPIIDVAHGFFLFVFAHTNKKNRLFVGFGSAFEQHLNLIIANVDGIVTYSPDSSKAYKESIRMFQKID